MTKLYRTGFWMKHFNSLSPKRTRLWSHSWGVSFFNRGKLGKKKGKCKGKTSTTKIYFDKQGKKRFTAASGLKQTQNLTST